MLKALALAGALATATASAAPAMADGFYINAERNDGFVGSTHSGAVSELHVGYDGSIGSMPFYIQGGPAYLTPPGVDGEVELSGKVGGGFAISPQLGAYWEASFVTGDDNNGYGTKLGAKYSF